MSIAELTKLISDAQAALAKKPRGKVAPKYKNPANGLETWTGRGRQPRWVADALAGGKSLDDLLI
jgi:DNA-binding protein H-NS